MLSLVAAMSKNRVIGKNGKIPWHLPADLVRFKKLTMGHPVIMGRKTYESLPPHPLNAAGQVGRALPGRANIVLSRNQEFEPPDAVTVPSLKEALDLTVRLRSPQARGANEVFVIGGQSLYEQALPLADRIYLTAVDVEINAGSSQGLRSCDDKKLERIAFFPKFSEDEWTLISREEREKDEKNPHDCAYLIFERKKQ